MSYVTSCAIQTNSKYLLRSLRLSDFRGPVRHERLNVYHTVELKEQDGVEWEEGIFLQVHWETSFSDPEEARYGEAPLAH